MSKQRFAGTAEAVPWNGPAKRPTVFSAPATPDFGLTLHPFDLATNKLSPLVGRSKYATGCDLSMPASASSLLGIWRGRPAAGPGFSPKGILVGRRETARYPQRRWGDWPSRVSPLLLKRCSPPLACHAAGGARELVDILPLTGLGQCVLASDGTPFRAKPATPGDPRRLSSIRAGSRSIGRASSSARAMIRAICSFAPSAPCHATRGLSNRRIFVCGARHGPHSPDGPRTPRWRQSGAPRSWTFSSL